MVTFGCRPADTIRTYDAPKPPGPVPEATSQVSPVSPNASGEKTDRMLALVLPGGGQAWFFKLVGKLAEVQAIADEVTNFYRNVRIGDDGKPVWQLPDGWTAAPPAGMRLATITAAEEFEMSVIGLPLTGEWDAQLLGNVNRWRSQMSLPPTDAGTLAEEVQPVEGVDDAVIIDLVGSFSSGSMRAPFAGGGRMTAPPVRPSAPSARAPIAPASKKLNFKIPDGWIDRGATAMRKANFFAGGENQEQAAQVRAMAFPAFGQMGDPLANVNRWRGQVGLPPIGADDVTQAATPVRVAGEDAVLFDIQPEDAGENATAITAAMSKRGDQVWFFMMSGPAVTVAAERGRYDEWLASIRFGVNDPPVAEEESNAPENDAGNAGDTATDEANKENDKEANNGDR